MERLLEAVAGDLGVVTTEFPYIAPFRTCSIGSRTVAYIPQADWDALPPDVYPVCSAADR
jgi:hypothetical protein